MVSMPLGILNAVLVNVGCVLVLKVIPIIKFKIRHYQQYVSVFVIFLFSYFSLGLMIMKRYYQEGNHRVPPDFTRDWLQFYGQILTVQMMMSNLLQYIGPVIKVLIRRGCCCCVRKNYKLNKNNNSVFSFERRYGTLITTVFTCFTYGLAIPTLFLTASVVFWIQFFLDKILITYYYKE
jgi:hypothetical protein